VYLKDEAELNHYLLQSALDNAEVHVSADAPALSATALADLAHEFITVMTTIDRFSRRYARDLLEQLIYMPSADDALVQDRSRLESWLDELQGRLNAERSPSDLFELELGEAPETGETQIIVRRRIHGLTTEQTMPLEFFRTVEYRRIRELGEKLDGLLSPDAYVKRGERRREITTFKQALDWLMEEAKRGQSIQRYKGLGEMNSDQLWETTMNPDTRRLLRVTIEDAVASDQIFTTLMGDQVEPRREFIERNALAVENLDV
jgi:DNA gyrase subunit B